MKAYLVQYGLYYETQLDFIFKYKKDAEKRVKELNKQYKKEEKEGHYSKAEILEKEIK